MANRVRVGVDEVVGHFEELEDPRSSVNLRHPLGSVVVIAIMAVLAGAGGGPTAIAKWAAMKEELLARLLPLPNGIPRKDVFRRVLATLKPDAFQACFVSWLEALRTRASMESDVDRPVLAVDGKKVSLRDVEIDAFEDMDDFIAHLVVFPEILQAQRGLHKYEKWFIRLKRTWLCESRGF